MEAPRPAGGGAVGHTEQVELVVPEGKNVQRDRCSPQCTQRPVQTQRDVCEQTSGCETPPFVVNFTFTLTPHPLQEQVIRSVV